MITQSKVFRSVALEVVPAASRLDEAGWRDVNAIVEHAIAQRPARMRRQLVLFLRVLNVLSLVRHGRPVQRLSASVRTRFLERLERSPLLVLRRGFWGVRTLVLMGYYARPAARHEIGYRAHPLGWQVRR